VEGGRIGLLVGPVRARPGKLVSRPAGWTQKDVRGGRGGKAYFIAMGTLGTMIGTNAQLRRAGAPVTASA